MAPKWPSILLSAGLQEPSLGRSADVALSAQGRRGVAGGVGVTIVRCISASGVLAGE